jgi:hypothetical protein
MPVNYNSRRLQR